MTPKYKIINNEPDAVNEPSGVYQPQQPLTFERVWEMIQETDKQIKETNKQFQETKQMLREQSKEFDRWLKEKSKENDRLLQEQSMETEKWMKEQSVKADRHFKETERIVRNVSKNLGGIGNNIGEATEEYFRGAFKRKRVFAGVKIKFVGRLNKQLETIGGEYDVVLFGEDTLVIVEVKHKLTRDDVSWFVNKSLKDFKTLFPEYAGFKVLGAVAAMTAQKTAIKLAIKDGLFVVTQSGQKISVLNPGDFDPREF
jgi:hypothetical protein